MGPWNEEDFGWEFSCIIKGIRFSFLIQSLDEMEWLLIITPVTLLRFFLRKKVDAVLETTAEQVDRTLKSSTGFRDIRWLNAKQFEELRTKSIEATR